MTPGKGTQAILLAAPGSSCLEAAAGFDRIRQMFESAFPGFIIRWTFTSSGIRRKLGLAGRPVSSPHEALATLLAEGISRVTVMPLHLAEGMEYRELVDTVVAVGGKGAFEVLKTGRPLLTEADAWKRSVRAVLDSLKPMRRAEDGVVLIAHGSTEPQACGTYEQAVARCREWDPRLFMGMMLGAPLQPQVIEACRHAGISKVWLIPAMVVTGFSAQHDIGGDGEQSWKSGFQRSGIQCEPVLKALGEVEGVVQVWIESCLRLTRGE